MKYTVIKYAAAAASFVFMWVVVSSVISAILGFFFPPAFYNGLNLVDWRTYPGIFFGSGAAVYWAYNVLRLRSPA